MISLCPFFLDCVAPRKHCRHSADAADTEAIEPSILWNNLYVEVDIVRISSVIFCDFVFENNEFLQAVKVLFFGLLLYNQADEMGFSAAISCPFCGFRVIKMRRWVEIVLKYSKSFKFPCWFLWCKTPAILRQHLEAWGFDHLYGASNAWARYSIHCPGAQ